MNVGTRLGDYVLLEALGRGGSATVFKAQHVATGRMVACKLLGKGLGDGVARRFRSEARILSGLAHPAIVRLFGIHEDDGQLYLSMQYVDGTDLSALIERRRRAGETLERAFCFDVSLRVLSALHYISSLEVVHRDIKPANILVATAGEVLVGDFGLARFRDMTRMTRDGQAVGTVKYMAPEQLRGEEGCPRCDLYQVGLVLCEALTGILPYADRDSVYAQALARAERPVSRGFPSATTVEPALLCFLDRVCHADPRQRPSSAAAMIDDLLQLAAQLGVPATRPTLTVAGADVRSPSSTDDTAAPLPSRKTKGSATDEGTLPERTTTPGRWQRTLRGGLLGACCAFAGRYAIEYTHPPVTVRLERSLTAGRLDETITLLASIRGRTRSIVPQDLPRRIIEAAAALPRDELGAATAERLFVALPTSWLWSGSADSLFPWAVRIADRARDHLAAGRHDDARNLLTAAAEDLPLPGEVATIVAACVENVDTKERRAWAHHVIERSLQFHDGSSAEAWRVLADLRRRDGDEAGRLAALRRAVRVEPTAATARIDLAVALSERPSVARVWEVDQCLQHPCVEGAEPALLRTRDEVRRRFAAFINGDTAPASPLVEGG